MQQAIDIAVQIAELAGWAALAAVLFLLAFLVISGISELLYRGIGKALLRWSRVSAAWFRALSGRSASMFTRISGSLARLSDPKFRIIFHENEKRLISRISSVESALILKHEEIESINRSLERSYSKNIDAIDNYKNSSSESISWPSFQSSLKEIQKNGISSNSIIIILILVAIFSVFANTFMLNEFVSSLILGRLDVFGWEIRYSLLISSMISVIEVGVGAAISVNTGDDQKGSAAKNIAVISLYVVALSFLFLEFWLYSLLSSQINSVAVERLVESVPFARHGFAVVGLIFGLGIPVLGYACHHVYHQNRQRESLSKLREILHEAAAQAKLLPKLNEEIAQSASQARSALIAFREAFVADGEIPQIPLSIAHILDEFRQELDNAKRDRREIYADLSDEDAKLRLNTPLGQASIFVVTAAGLYMLLFGNLTSEFSGGVSVVLSSSWAGAALLAGRFAFGRVTLVQQVGSEVSRIVSADFGGALRWIAIVALAGLAVLGVLVAVDSSTGQVDWTTLVFLTVLSFVMALLGHLLDTVVDGIRTLLGICAAVCLSALEVVAAGVVFSIRALLILTAQSLKALGYPARAAVALFGTRRAPVEGGANG